MPEVNLVIEFRLVRKDDNFVVWGANSKEEILTYISKEIGSEYADLFRIEVRLTSAWVEAIEEP